MPWKSPKQARWGHSPSGISALGGIDKVKEWDSATPKGSLTEKKRVRHIGILKRIVKRINNGAM